MQSIDLSEWRRRGRSAQIAIDWQMPYVADEVSTARGEAIQARRDSKLASPAALKRQTITFTLAIECALASVSTLEKAHRAPNKIRVSRRLTHVWPAKARRRWLDNL
jgi:hypothetical protein